MGGRWDAEAGGIYKSAAVEVLRAERRLMSTSEIARAALKRGLILCRGKTPGATMASALYSDVKRKEGASAFIRPHEGLFGLREWLPCRTASKGMNAQGVAQRPVNAQRCAAHGQTNLQGRAPSDECSASADPSAGSRSSGRSPERSGLGSGKPLLCPGPGRGAHTAAPGGQLTPFAWLRSKACSSTEPPAAAAEVAAHERAGSASIMLLLSAAQELQSSSDPSTKAAAGGGLSGTPSGNQAALPDAAINSQGSGPYREDSAEALKAGPATRACCPAGSEVAGAPASPTHTGDSGSAAGPAVCAAAAQRLCALERSVRSLEQRLGTAHPQVGKAWLLLSRTFQARGAPVLLAKAEAALQCAFHVRASCHAPSLGAKPPACELLQAATASSFLYLIKRKRTRVHCNNCRSLRDRQTAAQLDPALQAVLTHSCRERYTLGQRLQAPPGLEGDVPDDDACVTSMELDSQGELLATTKVLRNTTHLSIIRFGLLREASASGARNGRPGRPVSPELVVASSKRRAEALRWNPGDENWVATASATDRTVHLCDLQYYQGTATCTLAAPADGAMGSRAVGFSDMAFLGGGPHLLAAAGRGGQVFFWDRRMRRLPVTFAAAARASGQLTSLQAVPDGRVVYAGTEAGEVLAWDIRGGAGVLGAQRQPQLAAVGLRAALGRLPRLAAETTVPTAAVDSLALDPRDPGRVAFHLSSGWSGALDMARERITHAHCPPVPAWMHTGDPSPDAPLGSETLHRWRRRGSWAAALGPFCVGAAERCGIYLLDFASAASPCAVGCERDEDSRRWPYGTPSAAQIATETPVVSAACHPHTGDAVLAGRDGSLAVLTCPAQMQPS
ncbi:hypothetical protein WJX81_002117 [Elliptochloris bilobata]|uniref:HTH HARE-type domain-containing protein n=1 Tax=Elliptochloris bilobata TaxID=381761 RepID=A0AAW1RN90_9CHLO